MSQVNRPAPVFKVVLTEYERGYGSKVDDILYFDNEAEAIKYAEEYNRKHNNETMVPDWYIRADYRGKMM